MSSPTIRCTLDTIDPSQSGADVTHNLALIKLDFLVGGAIKVINSTTAAAPGSPTNGDTYLVATGGSGAFAGHDGQIALYNAGWYFFVVQVGWMIYDAAAGTLKLWNGTTYKTITLT